MCRSESDEELLLNNITTCKCYYNDSATIFLSSAIIIPNAAVSEVYKTRKEKGGKDEAKEKIEKMRLLFGEII